MSTWVIGDVQGCASTLERLLARVAFSPSRDRVLFCGDLVNRGARSLATLRLIVGLGPAAESVLGNHDLHLLGRALGVVERRDKDTLEEVLEAPDRGELLAWLSRRPLLHREAGVVVVHAGLSPEWSIERAAELAREAEAAIRGPAAAAFLSRLGSETPERPREDLDSVERALFAAHVLTRIRLVQADGRLFRFSGSPIDAPKGTMPWFAKPGRASAGETIAFGHWSALGLHVAPRLYGLDTGCVWGRSLTALRLEDRSVVQEPQAAEDRAQKG